MNGFLSFLLLASVAFSQQLSRVFPADSIKRNSLSLQEKRLIEPQSLKVYADSTELSIDYDFIFHGNQNQIEFRTDFTHAKEIHVTYKIINLFSSYQRYALPPRFVAQSDTNSLQAALDRQQKTTLQVDKENYYAKMNKTGGIYRGFKLGTANDLSLESGMNITLDGPISEELTLQAAITDESIPIQPEGTTERLSDIDQIYIKVSSPTTEAVFGDFNLALEGNSLFAYSRRLKGAMMGYSGSTFSSSGAFASTRARFHSQQLLTKNGLQGPYQLTAENKSEDIIVIAGSERVYLDGNELRRGSLNDYTIEYATGSIYFTSARLISANQRIEVDFEYVSSQQRFGRNVNYAEAAYSGSKLTYKTRFVEEADDDESPLTGFDPFNAEEKTILEAAGADQSAASVSGITRAALNNGLYNKQFNPASNDTILVFDRSRKGAYNVVFSRLGTDAGSHKRVSRVLNQFEFVGKGAGDYEPVILLNLPANHRMWLNQLTYSYSPQSSIALDYALSHVDKNVLSKKDNNAQDGHYLTLKNVHKADHFWGFKQVDLQQEASFYDEKFESLNKFYSNDFYARWGVLPLERQASRFTYEHAGRWQWSKQLRFSTALGFLREGNAIDANQASLRIEKEFESDIPNLSLFASELNSSQNIQQRHIERLSAQASLSKTYSRWQYKTDVNATNYQNTSLEKDVGFKTEQGKIFAKVQLTDQYSLSSESAIQTQSAFDSTRQAFRGFADEFGQRIESVYNSGNLRLSTTAAYRNRDISPFFLNLESHERLRYVDIAFNDTSFANQASYLLENELAYKNHAMQLRFSYSAKNELMPFKEYIYQEVNKGYGQFRLDSVGQQYVVDNISGNFIRYTIPNGNFLPVTTLQSEFSLLFQAENSKIDFIRNTLRRYQFNTRFQVQDRSQSENKFSSYIIQPSKLLGAQTLSGRVNFQQFIYLDRDNAKRNYTASFEHRSNLQQDVIDALSEANTGVIQNQWTLQHNRTFSEKFNSSSLFRYETHKVNNPSRADLRRDISGYALDETLRYFPSQPLLISLSAIYNRQADEKPKNPIVVQNLDATLGLNYSFAERGYTSASFMLSHVDVLENKDNLYIPNELSQGKKEGNNYTWNVTAHYGLGNNVSVNLTYNGRKHVIDLEAFHLFRLEMRLTL